MSYREKQEKNSGDSIKYRCFHSSLEITAADTTILPRRFKLYHCLYFYGNPAGYDLVIRMRSEERRGAALFFGLRHGLTEAHPKIDRHAFAATSLLRAQPGSRPYTLDHIGSNRFAVCGGIPVAASSGPTFSPVEGFRICRPAAGPLSCIVLTRVQDL